MPSEERMNILNSYDIAFRALGDGSHRYRFESGDEFFGFFENPDILGGNVTSEVVLNKTASGMVLEFEIGGEVRVACDRCLEECEFPVDYEGELTVKFTSEQIEGEDADDGEVVWMNPKDNGINVARYIYESVVLSLPMQRFHPDREDGTPGCDPQILSRAGLISEEEFERRAAVEEHYKMEDTPAGDALRELKNKLEKQTE